MEEQARHVEGISFLNSTERDWRVSTGLSPHLCWHLALYYIERAQYDMALAVYDKDILPV